MNKLAAAAALAAVVCLVLCGCRKREPERFLVASEIAHFEIQGNGKTLNLPVFAGTLSTDEIARDVSLADYYYQKLSAVYEFKAFTFVNATTTETLLDRSGEFTAPQKVYEFQDSLSKIELWMTAFTSEKATCLFRLSDKKNGQVRDHAVEVPAGKSSSVGTLYDREKNRGHLIAVSALSLTVTPQVTVEQLTAFLKNKNTPRGGNAPEFFKSSDQRWMDELFGAQAVKLPVEPAIPAPDDTTKYIELDVPPTPIGSMMPEYSAAAKQSGIEGTVFVQAYINKNGEVKSAKIIRGLHADLDSAAVRAVYSTRFQPAMQKGNPVGVWVTIPFRFKLN